MELEAEPVSKSVELEQNWDGGLEFGCVSIGRCRRAQGGTGYVEPTYFIYSYTWYRHVLYL